MNNDNLKNSLASFIAWRKAQDYRAKVSTRAGMLAYHGKGWAMSEDHKRAYFHAVEDFGPVVWDSKQDNKRGTMGFYDDNFASETICWCVVKIAPANKKHGREALYARLSLFCGLLVALLPLAVSLIALDPVNRRTGLAQARGRLGEFAFNQGRGFHLIAACSTRIKYGIAYPYTRENGLYARLG